MATLSDCLHFFMQFLHSTLVSLKFSNSITVNNYLIHIE